VYDVLEYLASGMTGEEIVADFPELTADPVRAALEFAALRERRLAAALKLLFDQNRSGASSTTDATRSLAVSTSAPLDLRRRPIGRSGTTPAHEYVAVSKDSDFSQLAFLDGLPPKVLWLRVGNAWTVDIVHLILDNIEVIERFVDGGAEVGSGPPKGGRLPAAHDSLRSEVGRKVGVDRGDLDAVEEVVCQMERHRRTLVEAQVMVLFRLAGLGELGDLRGQERGAGPVLDPVREPRDIAHHVAVAR